MKLAEQICRHCPSTKKGAYLRRQEKALRARLESNGRVQNTLATLHEECFVDISHLTEKKQKKSDPSMKNELPNETEDNGDEHTESSIG